MSNRKKSTANLVWLLQERAKELNCLYKIEELLNKPDADLKDVCKGIIMVIPPGWQYPDVCKSKIAVEGKIYSSPDFKETPWVQSADITVQDKAIGKISIYYTEKMPKGDEGPFLKEETKLLQTIADRLGNFILHKRMKKVFQNYETAREDLSEHRAKEWRVALNLLHHTDKDLFLSISRRMLNYLCWSGIDEAKQLLSSSSTGQKTKEDELLNDENRPHQKSILALSDSLSEKTFNIAAKHLSDKQIFSAIQKWIQEDRLGFLVQVTSMNLSLAQVANALRRYHHIEPEGIELSPAIKRGVQVSLIRRFLSEQPQFINVAKKFIEISDFYNILDRIVFSAESHGKLGGKSAGLFLAEQIIKKSSKSSDYLDDIKVPKTWYITSDTLLNFLNYNNLNEVVEQKYKEINQVRVEYPHIVQTFKNCRFPPEILQGISMALDDFKDRPLIVRSSSLLEDRIGAVFSGKYRSLFLANRGSKQKRLEALTDAIAEVYASTFGPDPIEYRSEKGLIDFNEEMGIMIQEVVGTRVGDYFVPAYAGVAFS
ncbi:MAG: pyruvate, phosphate dikinase, partial [Proteobacteria bacterium]|nr:pyruvate, phosphate dikinase [Pseudomonadota bacterium]